jgi:hypothetical protein
MNPFEPMSINRLNGDPAPARMYRPPRTREEHENFRREVLQRVQEAQQQGTTCPLGARPDDDPGSELCELPPGFHWYAVRFNVIREKGEQRGFGSFLAAPNPMMAARRARRLFLRQYGHVGTAPAHELHLRGLGYTPLIPPELGRVKGVRVTSAVEADEGRPRNRVSDPHGQEAG